MWSDLPPADWPINKVHFLQSGPWAHFQNILGKRTVFARGDGWSWLAILESGRIGSRLYCPYGPTVESKAALNDALTALAACAKSLKATYVRVEPQGPIDRDDLQDLRLKPAHRDIQPHYTFIKDLSRPEAELLSEMSATNRNLHRTAANKGISFRSSTNPEEVQIFLDMMHEVAGRNGIVIHPDGYYQAMSGALMPIGALKLFIAELNGSPAASSLVFDGPATRYYAHAASFASMRKLHPGTPLLSHMIFEAKLTGKQSFDFFGIANPDNPNPNWQGFTEFKQSFGGHPKDMHGTWELGVNNLKYSIYRTLAKYSR